MSKQTLNLIKENEARWVDLRFTDTRGKEQHVTIPSKEVSEDFFDDGKTVDQLDLKKGFGPAWILDFTAKKAKDVITRDELENYTGKLVEGVRIIIRTGWDKVFPETRYFTDCPGIDPQACEYLAARKIACLAIDMPTVYGADYVTVHHVLLRAEILIVEGLTNLEKLKDDQVFFIAMPLRIKGGDGSPCRAAAIEGLSTEEMEILNTGF